MKPTILFTGGHHNSSLVIAQALKKQGYPVVWIGNKFNQGKDKSLSAEYQEVNNLNIPFYSLKTGKFYRKFNPFEHFKTILGFIQTIRYLIKIRPNLIISFGGYLAVPVVIIGWFLAIPSITHEQTTTTGWANKAIALFVKQILITHRSSLKNFPAHKTVLVGLPLEDDLLDAVKTNKTFHPPLLFITCGKQGAHLINQAVFPLIPQLIKRFTIVHQTGPNALNKDIDKARRLQQSLGRFKKRYLSAPYFFTKEYSLYLSSASLIISRSGAHTCYKIAFLNKRSVLIPIPWVSHNEQLQNALLTKRLASTIILQEKNLSPSSLLQATEQALKMKPKTVPSSLPKNATEKILKIVHQYV